MKKLTFAFAIVALMSFLFAGFAFSDPTPAKPKKSKVVESKDTKDVQGYIWIYWACKSWGSSFGGEIPPGQSVNAFETFGTQSPNPGYCNQSGGGVCAVRFLPQETEWTPGVDGVRRPKAGVTIWDASRVYITCQ